MTNYQNQSFEQEQEKWYETLWGLVILSVGVNVLSNWLYDKGRERVRLRDLANQKRRERKHLERQHNKTKEQAEQEEQDIENPVQ